MRIEKNIPIPEQGSKSKFKFLEDLEPNDCLCFDDRREWGRHVDGFRYHKIPYTSRKVEYEKKIPRADGTIEIVEVREYRIWRL